MSIYQAGLYKAVVKDGNYVDLYKDDVLITDPGPWNTSEGAHAWASEIVILLDAEETIVEE